MAKRVRLTVVKEEDIVFSVNGHPEIMSAFREAGYDDSLDDDGDGLMDVPYHELHKLVAQYAPENLTALEAYAKKYNIDDEDWIWLYVY